MAAYRNMAPLPMAVDMFAMQTEFIKNIISLIRYFTNKQRDQLKFIKCQPNYR